jgi:hypothetical protein
VVDKRFEDAKEVIGIRKSKKNRQHKGQKNKQRSTKRTHKTIDRVTRTPLTVRESFPLKMISVKKIISIFCLKSVLSFYYYK